MSAKPCSIGPTIRWFLQYASQAAGSWTSGGGCSGPLQKQQARLRLCPLGSGRWFTQVGSFLAMDVRVDRRDAIFCGASKHSANL